MSRSPMSRRATALAAALLGLAAAVLAVPVADAAEADDAARGLLDLTGAVDRTTTVPAASVPAESTGIGPGSHLLIEMDDGLYGCTSSWVFEDGGRLLLGAAGHCFLPSDATATHGRGADWDADDTHVRVCVSECSFGGLLGFVVEGTTVDLGPVAYARQEKKPDGEQVGWDFGVVEIPAALHDRVRTTMPVFGGPTDDVELATGDQVCHYGNGVVVGEVWPTMGRSGAGLFADELAWFAASAASPGDSGSALQTCVPGEEGLEGIGAVGTLTHLTLLGVAGTTNDQSIAMAADDAGLQLRLLLGDGSSVTGSSDGGSDDGGSGGGKPDHAGTKGKPTT